MNTLTVKKAFQPSGIIHIMLVLFAVVLFCGLPASAAGNSLRVEVESMSAMGAKVTPKQVAVVRELVNRNIDEAFTQAVNMLDSNKVSDAQRAVWVWVLGLTGRAEAVNHVIRQMRPSASIMLKANVDNALGELGGKKAGKFLYNEFMQAKSDAYKNQLLVLMARAGYEQALSRSTRLLELDPNSNEYKSAFFYGAMGNASVPFLISKLDHWSTNVRANSAIILGQWLLATEAVKPLIARFSKEKDPDVRLHILDALERTMYDLPAIEQFMKKAESQDKNSRVRKFARESIENIKHMREALELRYSQRRPDADAFVLAYKDLYKSRGRVGSFRTLGISSDLKDDMQLALLRSQILKRGTPESIYDAQKVNRIILINRLIQSVLSL